MDRPAYFGRRSATGSRCLAAAGGCRWRGKPAPATAIATPWAVGLNARYLIGIWTGRPDGTPVVGQFGFASAVPLLNQVNNLLLARPAMSRGGLPSDPAPGNGQPGDNLLAWRAGSSPAGDSNCRRRLASWLLDASQPPTLLLPGQESVRGIRFPVWRNEHGERVAADCPGARESQVEVWPLPLDPWPPASERRARAWDRHRSHARRYRLRIPRRWCCPASVMGQ